MVLLVMTSPMPAVSGPTSWKRFGAENSEVVEFEEGFSEDYSMKRAIDKDFEKNFKAAVEGLNMSTAIETKIGIF